MSVSESMNLVETIKQLCEIIGANTNGNKSVIKNIRETTDIISPKFIKFLIENDALEVIESSKGIFGPDNYFTKIEIPIELIKYLHESHEKKFEKIKSAISSKIYSLNINLDLLETYPKAFRFEHLPVDEKIFKKIISFDSTYIFKASYCSENLFKVLEKKKIDKNLLRAFVRRIKYDGNWTQIPYGLPNIFYDEMYEPEKSPSVIFLEKYYIELLENIETIKPNEAFNLFAAIAQRNTFIREHFEHNRERLSEKIKNLENLQKQMLFSVCIDYVSTVIFNRELYKRKVNTSNKISVQIDPAFMCFMLYLLDTRDGYKRYDSLACTSIENVFEETTRYYYLEQNLMTIMSLFEDSEYLKYLLMYLPPQGLSDYLKILFSVDDSRYTPKINEAKKVIKEFRDIILELSISHKELVEDYETELLAYEIKANLGGSL